jgi:hypothetical protein
MLTIQKGTTNNAIAPYALDKLSTGINNAAVNTSSLYNLTTGCNNTAVGMNSLFSVTNGSNNTAVGYNTFYNLNGGSSNNVAIGANAGINMSGTNCVVIGYNAGLNVANFSNAVAIGANTVIYGNNSINLGDPNTTLYAHSVAVPSDQRDKMNIRDTVHGLDFITKIRAVDYRWNYRESYRSSEVIDGQIIEKTLPNDGSKSGQRFHHGIVAQELQQLIQDTGVDFGGFQDLSVKGGTDRLKVNYLEFIGPLIKSVQQLKEEIDLLKKEVAVLKSEKK